MSVSSEFQRLIADCLTCLGTGDAREVSPWSEALTSASRQGEQDLSRAAESVLALFESPPAAPILSSELQQEEFARRSEHLEAICRVILGR